MHQHKSAVQMCNLHTAPAYYTPASVTSCCPECNLHAVRVDYIRALKETCCPDVHFAFNSDLHRLCNNAVTGLAAAHAAW